MKEKNDNDDDVNSSIAFQKQRSEISEKKVNKRRFVIKKQAVHLGSNVHKRPKMVIRMQKSAAAWCEKTSNTNLEDYKF